MRYNNIFGLAWEIGKTSEQKLKEFGCLDKL